MPVDVGTPGQRLYLAIDLFGESVFIAGPECIECCHKTRFIPGKSQTISYGERRVSLGNSPDTLVDNCYDNLSVSLLGAGVCTGSNSNLI